MVWYHGDSGTTVQQSQFGQQRILSNRVEEPVESRRTFAFQSLPVKIEFIQIGFVNLFNKPVIINRWSLSWNRVSAKPQFTIARFKFFWVCLKGCSTCVFFNQFIANVKMQVVTTILK